MKTKSKLSELIRIEKCGESTSLNKVKLIKEIPRGKIVKLEESTDMSLYKKKRNISTD